MPVLDLTYLDLTLFCCAFAAMLYSIRPTYYPHMRDTHRWPGVGLRPVALGPTHQPVAKVAAISRLVYESKTMS